LHVLSLHTLPSGYKIALSGSKTAVSNFRHSGWIGFLDCILSNYPKMPRSTEIMESIFFPTSVVNELVKTAGALPEQQ
jgi:hypothetical protein